MKFNINNVNDMEKNRMQRKNRGLFWLALCCAGIVSSAGTALDQDFIVIGDGQNAPSELAVYRRVKGYVIFVRDVDAVKETEIFLDCDNSVKTGEIHARMGADYRLKSNGIIEKYTAGKWEKTGKAQSILSAPGIRSFYIGDDILSILPETLIGVRCARAGTKRYLPDESNGALLVSGARKNAYSWNRPETTILKQVSNTKVFFDDPEGDIIDAGCDDLISGCAEVKDNELQLVCRTAAPMKNDLRIWIDSIPAGGYGPVEADFMMDGKKLFRYTGGNSGKWSWEKLSLIEPEVTRGGTEIRYKLPLNLIRPQKYGRLRICFQTAPDMERGDSMPSRGKVFPVLRPGNLASASGTRVEVSSLYPKYKIYPLTDGQTARQIYYSYAAWASAEMRGKAQFADFIFQKAEPVNLVSVWWEKPPREIEIFGKQGGEWRLLARKTIPEKEEWSNIPLPENSRAEAIRVQMPAGKGNKSRPNLFWIREVEIY